MKTKLGTFLLALALLTGTAAACGDDDGGTVRDIGGESSGSGSGSGSGSEPAGGSGSGSEPAGGSSSAP